MTPNSSQAVSSVTNSAQSGTEWPAQFDIFGVNVSATNYSMLTERIITAAQRREPAVVTCHAVHALVESCSDQKLREAANRFEVVAPDGQPVRWSLKWLHGINLADRVYGPQLTLEVCRRAAEEAVPVYLYGGSEKAVSLMATNLEDRFPGLDVVGIESPPFRKLTADEDAEVVRRINDSGAGIVFIGLGFPKQDQFAAAHQNRITPVQICVGAAFDFHAGLKATAPEWMQRRGLEWLFRLSQEPGRLWKRYFVTNSLFLLYLFQAMCFRSRRAPRTPEMESKLHA